MKRVKVTDQDREKEAGVRANGGSMTAADFAHSRVYEYVGVCAGPMPADIREWLGDGGYRAADGSLYRKRDQS